MLRLSPGNTETDARWEETLDIIKRAPGCCDDVWFSTGTGVPHLSWRRERAARIARASSELRAVGIGASLQVQATIDRAWRRTRNRWQPRNGARQPQDVSGQGVKRLCADSGVEIVPAIWSFGYGALQNYGVDALEGVPVEGTPFVATGGARGILYTTWRQDYRDLPAFMKMVNDAKEGQ